MPRVRKYFRDPELREKERIQKSISLHMKWLYSENKLPSQIYKDSEVDFSECPLSKWLLEHEGDLAKKRQNYKKYLATNRAKQRARKKNGF